MTDTTTWNPETYAKNARFVSDLGAPLVQLLEPLPGELILDLGCGDGALSEKIAAANSRVICIDRSTAQVRAAQSRGLLGVVMDGQQVGFKRGFDAVFTNAVLHWMKRPEKVIAGVADCLKNHGRFVGEFGGKGNVETIRSALHAGLRRRGIDPWTVDPWYYPSPEEYSQLLTAHGFAIDYIELIPRPTKLPGDIVGWLDVFAQPFSNSIAASERANYLSEVRLELQPQLQKADGWYADYVRLRFRAMRGL